MTADEARDFAKHWVDAWNAHDLDAILAHYEQSVDLSSPAAAKLVEGSGGKVSGKENLRAYFELGLRVYPQLHFHLEDVLWGMNSVVLYYTNQTGTRTAEFMEFSATGKVQRVVAHYNS